MMKILAGEGVELSEEQKGKVTEGVDWLKDWVSKRYQNGHFIDRIDSNRSEAEVATDEATGKLKYQETMKKLDEVTVCVCKDEAAVWDYVKKGIREGTLHLTSGLEPYGGDANRAAEEYETGTNGGEKFYGVRCSDIVEPIVFVTEEAVNDGLTASVVAHETTHLLELKNSELKASPGQFEDGSGLYFENSKGDFLLNEEVQADEYFDAGDEVYARLMQMRKGMGIDPDKVFTPEDVAKLREKDAKDIADYKIKLGLDPAKKYSDAEIRKAQKEHPEAGKVSENALYRIFSRYTDEQISFLLNETADIGKPRENETPERMDVRVAMQTSALMADVNFETFQQNEINRQAGKEQSVSREVETSTKKTELSPAMMMRLRSGNQYT